MFILAEPRSMEKKKKNPIQDFKTHMLLCNENNYLPIVFNSLDLQFDLSYFIINVDYTIVVPYVSGSEVSFHVKRVLILLNYAIN